MKPGVVVGMLLAAPSFAADTSTWTRHHAFDGRLQFSFPADLLTVKEDGGRVMVWHSVPWRHYHPCDDMEEHELDTVTDLAIEFRLDEFPETAVARA